MATRRRRTTPARRRRTYRRRNPDLFKRLSEGVVGAAYIVAGEAVTRAVPRMLNLPAGGATGMAAQVAVAVAAGMAAESFAGRDRGSRVLEGGLAVVLRDLASQAGVPGLSAYAPSYTPPVGGGRVIDLQAYANMNGYPGERRSAGVAGGW